MALVWRDQFNLRPTGVQTTVPDDDVARLMYYLHCVFTAIEYEDQDVRRYRDYQVTMIHLATKNNEWFGSWLQDSQSR